MSNFGVYLEHKYDPPFEDWWAVKMINHDMKALSIELLTLPVPLPPLLAKMSRCLEVAVNTRRSEWESGGPNE